MGALEVLLVQATNTGKAEHLGLLGYLVDPGDKWDYDIVPRAMDTMVPLVGPVNSRLNN